MYKNKPIAPELKNRHLISYSRLKKKLLSSNTFKKFLCLQPEEQEIMIWQQILIHIV